MSAPEPIYTLANCTFCSPLEWGLSVFWRTPVTDASWLPELTAATATDGIRLLGHRFSKPGVSQFVLSTTPATAPQVIVHRVKGRLQYLVRDSLPKALKGNYALRSFGRTTREAVEEYVASQLGHHRMADERVQTLLQQLQIVQPDVNLTQPRTTAHGLYWYNLHLVLVHRERWAEIRESVLRAVRKMILGVCRKKNYALSRAGILADHAHLAVGCPLDASPAEVALAFLNNLAYAHGMKAVYQFGAYVGTFGEYDQNAVESDVPGELGGDEKRRE